MTKTRFMALTAQFYQLFRLGKKPLADSVLPQKPTSLLRRRGLISMGIFLAFIFSSFLVLPTNAWADDDEEEKEYHEKKLEEITNFVNNKLIPDDAQTRVMGQQDAETLLSRVRGGNFYNLTADEYNDIRGNTTDDYSETNSLFDEAAADAKGKDVKTYAALLFSEITKLGEKYNNLLDTFNATYKCDTTIGGTRGLNLKNLLGKTLYSYVWDANARIESCKTLNRDDPTAKANMEELLEIAFQLDGRKQIWRVIKDQAEGEIYQYQYCAKYKDNSRECESYGTFDFLVVESEAKIVSLSGATAGCVPLPFKLYEAKSCLFCPLFDIIFTTIDQASASAYSKLGESLSTLTAIGLAIWIAFMVLQNVSAMTKQDALEFLTKLFQASFKVIIAIVLLRNAYVVYGWIIGPLLKTGFEFGMSFLERASENSALIGCDKLITGIKNVNATASIGSVFPDYVFKNLICLIKSVQMELAASQAIGSSLMCISRNQALSNLGALAKVLPDFSMMLQGALIWVISFIMSLAFGFYLVDATIQLGIFGVLLPFLILCWPFKMTKSYFDKGVGVFMNSWFVYVFMGIVINIDIKLIGNSLTGGKGGFNAVEAAINGNDVRQLQELLSIGFAGFLVLIACCIFSIKLLMKVEDLAGQFSGGGLNLGIGSQVGGLAASGATNLAKQGLQTGKNIASGAYHAKVWKGSDGKFRGLDDAASWAGNKFKQGAGNVGRSVTFPIRHPQQTYRKAKNAIGAMFGSGRRGASE